MDKKALSECDVCTKFITPAIEAYGHDRTTLLLEGVNLTSGRIVIRENRELRDHLATASQTQSRRLVEALIEQAVA